MRAAFARDATCACCLPAPDLASSAATSSPPSKILARPRLVERIRASIADPSAAHLVCFNSSPLERSLAVRLGIPLYASDPSLYHLGTKSGCRETFREAGVPMVASAWYGLMLPAHAPKDIVARLNTEVNRILKTREFHDRLTAMGAIVLGDTPEDFAKFNAEEVRRYETIVRDSGAPKE